MLPSMAAGLGSILFAITIDNSVLNNATDPFVKSHLDEISILASIKKSTSSSTDSKTDISANIVKKKKKPRKVAAKIVDFDETDIGKMREMREASMSSDTRSESSAMSMPTPSRKQKNNSPTPSLNYDPIHLSDSRRKIMTSTKSSSKSGENDDDLDIYSRSSVDDVDQVNSSMNLADSSLSTLTPIRNVEIGGLIPLSANGELRHDVQVKIFRLRLNENVYC
jgi:hypothetical protein